MIKILSVGVTACILAASTPAFARDLFDGDWVADLDEQSGLGADIYLVRDGQYSCASCEPPRATRRTESRIRFPAIQM